MERLHIENFGGIKNADLQIRSINLFIGESGTGKSVAIKLVYFFKELINDIPSSIFEGDSAPELEKRIKSRFLSYFPKESWPSGAFAIMYEQAGITIKTIRQGDAIKVHFDEVFKKNLTKVRRSEFAGLVKKETKESGSYINEERAALAAISHDLKKFYPQIKLGIQHFIPAGRGFFALLQQNIFRFLSENRSLDPFLAEFGSLYNRVKFIYEGSYGLALQKSSFWKQCERLLGSSYTREKGKDLLTHPDGRKVGLANASSGQQELLPLVLVLNSLPPSLDKQRVLFIEEPEAHLFPSTQKAIVELLASVFAKNAEHLQLFITTHSPYLLSCFNNHIQAAIAEPLIEPSEFYALGVQPLNADLFSVYQLKNGEAQSITDKEDGLIMASGLDDVSHEISTAFGRLLEAVYP